MDKVKVSLILLSEIMDEHKNEIKNIVNNHPSSIVQKKPDGSPVTELDLALCAFVEKLAQTYFSDATFYSEEKFSTWSFPLLALDPLDGTQEYIMGRDEWVISLGLFQNDKFQGQGWIFNPKTGECFSSPVKIQNRIGPNFTGEVSRSEWKRGLFKNKSTEKFVVTPIGSIAYKLGRLAVGQSDYVVSLTPKNIWDVAGGTLLCQESGIKFYSEGKEVTRVEKFYNPPLIWCRPELFEELSKIYL